MEDEGRSVATVDAPRIHAMAMDGQKSASLRGRMKMLTRMVCQTILRDHGGVLFTKGFRFARACSTFSSRSLGVRPCPSTLSETAELALLSSACFAEGRLLGLIRRCHAFGMTLMKLDVRQESGRHCEVLDAVTQFLGIGRYSDWEEERKCSWLLPGAHFRRMGILLRKGSDRMCVFRCFIVEASFGVGFVA